MPSEITLGESMPVRCRGRVLRIVREAISLERQCFRHCAEPKIGVAVRLEDYEYLPGSPSLSASFARGLQVYIRTDQRTRSLTHSAARPPGRLIRNRTTPTCDPIVFLGVASDFSTIRDLAYNCCATEADRLPRHSSVVTLPPEPLMVVVWAVRADPAARHGFRQLPRSLGGEYVLFLTCRHREKSARTALCMGLPSPS